MDVSLPLGFESDMSAARHHDDLADVAGPSITMESSQTLVAEVLAHRCPATREIRQEVLQQR